MFFAPNIKLLRKRRGRTQDDVAFALNMKRPTLSGYENLVSQPSIEVLVAFSDYYNIAIDTLIKVDLSKLGESQLKQLENGFDVYMKGSGLRVLVSTVDGQNRDNIELVTEKAKAGYSNGYSDPEFIGELPVYQLPFLSREKKYRTFQISGDSMLPIPHEAWVTGEFVQDWTMLKDGDAAIVVTLDEGVVFKILEHRLTEQQAYILHSLNTLYHPYEVNVSQIKEIWRFVHFISPELPDADASNDKVMRSIETVKRDLTLVKQKMGIEG
jgi:transcriptional regulator with XRE-family HTH domain